MDSYDIVSKIQLVTGENKISLEGRFNQYKTDDIHPLYSTLGLLEHGLEMNDMPEFNGYKMKQSDRYKLFTRDEPVCVCCGRKASFFASQTTGKSGRTHLNMYGLDENGNTIMFTKDHIVPQSFGGYDELENYQIMCSECNEKKGNEEDIEYFQYSVRIQFKDEYNFKNSPIQFSELHLNLKSISVKGAQIVAKGYVMKRFKGAKITNIITKELTKD